MKDKISRDNPKEILHSNTKVSSENSITQHHLGSAGIGFGDDRCPETTTSMGWSLLQAGLRSNRGRTPEPVSMVTRTRSNTDSTQDDIGDIEAYVNGTKMKKAGDQDMLQQHDIEYHLGTASAGFGEKCPFTDRGTEDWLFEAGDISNRGGTPEPVSKEKWLRDLDDLRKITPEEVDKMFGSHSSVTGDTQVYGAEEE